MMPLHYVYLLESSDGKYYTGYTTDLERRMEQHRSGKGAKFTRGFGFKKLLYSETYRTKSKAMKREAEIKSWNRTEKKALIDGESKKRILWPRKPQRK
jgi:putative endonuclease